MRALVYVFALLSLPGCATLGSSSTARAVVALAAAPATDLAVEALEAEIASLPADPAGLGAWCLAAGLTSAEADLVVAEASGELAAVLGSLPRYLEGGALGRLALSALAGERPETVGPREAARWLLAWAQSREAAEGRGPSAAASGGPPAVPGGLLLVGADLP